ncbi:MAG: dual specificity protein phosphatase family protein [Rhizobiales bacterium]|nr:dual specificity protein phosphatase family protein [Hyphomicrobiales bacterium]
MHDAIEPFTIATIATGSGQIGIARLPGRAGDIVADVSSIRHWGAQLVVSMTESDEMAAAGASGLAAGLTALDIAHHHFPIRDFGVPERTDARWPALSRILHARLDAGEAVLLHCMGGKGRSGMLALRLLVERGMEPEAALRVIRQARPGAVETPEQEDWGKGRT